MSGHVLDGTRMRPDGDEGGGEAVPKIMHMTLLADRRLRDAAESALTSAGEPAETLTGYTTLRLEHGGRRMVAVAAAELSEIVSELRELLKRVDFLLDDSLPPHAASEARAAREQLVSMIEDSLDLIEVEEAFKEAGDERIPWQQFHAGLPPA